VQQMADAQNGEGSPNMMEFQVQASGPDTNEKASRI